MNDDATIDVIIANTFLIYFQCQTQIPVWKSGSAAPIFVYKLSRRRLYGRNTTRSGRMVGFRMGIFKALINMQMKCYHCVIR